MTDKEKLQCMQLGSFITSGQLLEDSNLSINEISISVGFKDVAYFYKVFVKYYGITPKKYREKHKTNKG
jgi:YesN/AraC family two-component response regulator